MRNDSTVIISQLLKKKKKSTKFELIWKFYTFMMEKNDESFYDSKNYLNYL